MTAITFLLCGLMLAGCVTPVTEADLEADLKRVGEAVPGLGRHRVIAIHAETSLVAWALLTEAKRDPDSALSVSVARRIAVASSRRMGVVVGGPYPKLSDQVLRNAFALNRDRSLRGLRMVFVGSDEPSPELARAVTEARARMLHRRLP